MPLPAWLARFNRTATNRVGTPIAARAPGLAVVLHLGRRSGRVYRTPIAVFRDGDAVVIALTYGARSEWVRNVMAAGECEIDHRGHRVHLVDPELITWHEAVDVVPAVIRSILIVMNVDEFLRLRMA
jgi:deazaflavin-dependent oxidoreductase (nitroreductase family)